MTISVQLLQIPATETVSKREYYFDADYISIGRDFTCEICLPDLSNTILPVHVKIYRTETGSYSIMTDSEDGTLLNDQELHLKGAQILKDGDTLNFCGYKLMFGLIEKSSVDEVQPPQYGDFHVETDIASDGPLLPELEVEDTLIEPVSGLQHSDLDLEEDLLFDPFADGPSINEAPQQNVPTSIVEQSVEVMDVAAFEKSRQLDHINSHNNLQREKVSSAIEKAIERFLQELDPAVLKQDYDELIPRFVNRDKRYWRIHTRQFARKKANGEFRRSFMALFAEEMRKL